jgi:sugar diacid utilization regulator
VAARRPGTGAAAVNRPKPGHSGVERIEKLLAGEQLDTSRLAYDFDVHHVAVVASGSKAEAAINELTDSLDLPQLVVRADRGVVWCWLGRRDGFSSAALEQLTASPRIAASSHPVADLRLAVGEQAHGLAGWRLSHHQARAALAVARRGHETGLRYSNVAVLASVVRDDLLETSMRRLYLEPLEDGHDGGEELRRTLRAYFEADRSISEAGSAIGVTRQAVARRLKAAEEIIGRPLTACGYDLELALRLEALDPTPLSAP